MALSLGLFFIALNVFRAITTYRSGALILDVRVTGLKTYHSIDTTGYHLVYGTTGQIFYRPKSVFEVIKYDDFEQYFANNLIFLILATTVFILSLKPGQVLFSRPTIVKFYGVLFFYIALYAAKLPLMHWIESDFYQHTGHLFKLDSRDGMSPNLWQVITMVFMFTVTGIIGAGIEREKPVV
ncbi:MAG: hypothetical protein V4619_14605 [Bacteroidota bacterium]